MSECHDGAAEWIELDGAEWCARRFFDVDLFSVLGRSGTTCVTGWAAEARPDEGPC